MRALTGGALLLLASAAVARAHGTRDAGRVSPWLGLEFRAAVRCSASRPPGSGTGSASGASGARSGWRASPRAGARWPSCRHGGSGDRAAVARRYGRRRPVLDAHGAASAADARCAAAARREPPSRDLPVGLSASGPQGVARAWNRLRPRPARAGAAAPDASPGCCSRACSWSGTCPARSSSPSTTRACMNSNTLSFFVTALMFWSVVIAPSSSAAELGVWRTLARSCSPTASSPAFLARSWCWRHARSTRSRRLRSAEWGLSGLEDQQIAGAIMWVVGGFIYLAAGSWLFVRWLEQADKPPPPRGSPRCRHRAASAAAPAARGLQRPAAAAAAHRPHADARRPQARRPGHPRYRLRQLPHHPGHQGCRRGGGPLARRHRPPRVPGRRAAQHAGQHGALAANASGRHSRQRHAGFGTERSRMRATSRSISPRSNDDPVRRALVLRRRRAPARRRAGARAPGLRRPQQPAVLQRQARGLREQDRRPDRQGSRRHGPIHVVGRAARLRAQHAEGRPLRSDSRHPDQHGSW